MKLFSPAMDLEGLRRVGLGPGPGARLLSTGVPDHWQGFGKGLAFGDAHGLFILEPDQAWWLPLPGEAVALAPWTDTQLGALIDLDDELLWLAIGLDDAPLPPVEERSWFSLGNRDLLAPVEGGETAIPWLPHGAFSALKSPLWGRAGLAWMDGRTLYRGLPERPCVSGSVDFDPVVLFPGPLGAQLILGESRWALVPPLGPPMGFDGAIEEGGYRFSSDGGAVLCRTEEGVVRARSAGLQVVDGDDSIPLGSEASPWWLDSEQGILRCDSTSPCMEGVFASAWSHDEEILVGPGGGIWGLEIGELRARDPGLCGDRVQVEPDRIRVEIEGKARLFDRQAQPLGTESCEESVADEAEPCTIETDGGSWKLGWDGLALWLPR